MDIAISFMADKSVLTSSAPPSPPSVPPTGGETGGETGGVGGRLPFSREVNRECSKLCAALPTMKLCYFASFNLGGTHRQDACATMIEK